MLFVDTSQDCVSKSGFFREMKGTWRHCCHSTVQDSVIVLPVIAWRSCCKCLLELNAGWCSLLSFSSLIWPLSVLRVMCAYFKNISLQCGNFRVAFSFSFDCYGIFSIPNKNIPVFRPLIPFLFFSSNHNIIVDPFCTEIGSLQCSELSVSWSHSRNNLYYHMPYLYFIVAAFPGLSLDSKWKGLSCSREALLNNI